MSDLLRAASPCSTSGAKQRAVPTSDPVDWFASQCEAPKSASFTTPWLPRARQKRKSHANG